ncbi:MAG: response regulator transcription factor [Actinobacteria bacterium]|nr:response regulator transcription factor [Actinomycetota bacterium]
MAPVRWIHLASALLWPAAAALGLWRARTLRRRRSMRRVHALMVLGLAVGAESLIQALSPNHASGAAHLVANLILALAGAAALFVLSAYGTEMANEERVLYALSRGHLGDGGVERPARPLSPREIEVLGYLCRGLKTDEIAERLSLSPHTASTHVRNLMRKLEVSSRVDAVSWAIRHGLYDPVTGKSDPSRFAGGSPRAG